MNTLSTLLGGAKATKKMVTVSNFTFFYNQLTWTTTGTPNSITIESTPSGPTFSALTGASTSATVSGMSSTTAYTFTITVYGPGNTVTATTNYTVPATANYLWGYDNSLASTGSSSSITLTAGTGRTMSTTSPAPRFGTHSMTCSKTNATLGTPSAFYLNNTGASGGTFAGFSATFWVYITSNTDGSTGWPCYFYWSQASRRIFVGSELNGSQALTNVHYFTFCADGSNQRNTSVTTTLALNTWHFFAISLTTGGNTIFQINGLQSTASPGTIGTNYNEVSGTMYVANENGGNCRWAGRTDQLRVYRRALSSAEISAIYAEAP